MPGTANRARTPLSTARLYAASLPDGNSNVIEISASAKSHLQRERALESPPPATPIFCFISAMLKTAALLFLLLYFFSTPNSFPCLCLRRIHSCS